MIRVGVISALQLEARSLYSYPALAVRVCGVSAPEADDVVRALAGRGCRLIVSWGTAGALSPRARAGDLIIPEQVIAASGGLLTTDNGAREALRDKVKSRWPVTAGTLLESDRMLGTPADKGCLGRRREAVAVDMESGRIGEACAALKLPFLVVRVVVDELDDRLPQLLQNTTSSRGALRMAPLLAGLMAHPGELAALARLGRRYRRARRALEAAAWALGRYAEQRQDQD